MLTKDEAELVLNRCKEYPAGLPANAWGCGPMNSEPDPEQEDYDYYQWPHLFDREVQSRYG